MKVTLIAAQSLDGFIAPHTQAGIASTTWTSREDSRFFQEKSTEIGLVIMGRTTWETIPTNHRPLSNRINIVLTSQPQKVDNSSDIAHLPPKSQMSTQKTFTTNLKPIELIEYLSSKGYEKAAVVGGASVYTAYMETNVINELFITLEPIIFGQGTSLFDKPMERVVHLAQTIKLANSVMVHHYLINKQ